MSFFLSRQPQAGLALQLKQVGGCLSHSRTLIPVRLSATLRGRRSMCGHACARTHRHTSGCVMCVIKGCETIYIQIYFMKSSNPSGSFHWFVFSNLYVAFFSSCTSPANTSRRSFKLGQRTLQNSGCPRQSHTLCSVPHLCALLLLFTSGRRFFWVLRLVIPL